MKLNFQGGLTITEFGEFSIIIIPTPIFIYKNSGYNKSIQFGIAFLVFLFSLELTWT